MQRNRHLLFYNGVMKQYLRKFRHHPLGLKSYGFLNYTQLPKGDYQETILKNITGKNWCCTRDFPLANNHCGAVCAINIYSYLTSDFRNMEMYQRIYGTVGDGPIIQLRKYILKLDDRIECHKGLDYQEIIEELLNNHPVSLLLGKAVNDFHWVMVIGVREYSNGQRYYRVIDGWNNNSLRYLPVDSAAVKIAAQSYSLK